MSTGFDPAHLTPHTAALLTDITRALAALQTTETMTKRRYGQWHTQHRPSVTADGANPAMGMAFSELFLGLLFGLPIFNGLSSTMVDAAHGLGQLGMMHNADRTPPATRSVVHLDAALAQRHKKTLGSALDAQQTQQAQLQQLQKMALMVLAMLAQQVFDEERGGTGDSGNVAPDVLRHPKLAFFKQNRHSMSCIRREFSEAVTCMTPPRFSGAKYALQAV